MNASQLSQLTDTTVVVWGAGREGRAAVRVLVSQRCSVVVAVDVVDDAARQLSAEFGVPLVSPTDVESTGATFVVRSPGISRYREEITIWQRAGIGSSGLFALWLADQDPNRVVAVTGTKGKSTTTVLIASILRTAGHEVHVAGNIGVPVTEVPLTGIAVVEVSSYQAADCTTSPAVAVLTALGEDHVTWHRTVDNYRADKLRLFGGSGQRAAVCDGTDPLVTALTVAGAESIVTGPWHVDHRRLVGGDRDVDASRVTAQVRRNLALAANSARLVDDSVGAAHLAAALEEFEPLPSRQREVAVIDGVRWVDDLLASNPIGVVAALESFADDPLIMLMGGADRGIDVAPIAVALGAARNVKSVVLMGDDADPLVEVLDGAPIPVVRIVGHDIAAAVAAAARLAVAGDVVIFSPGAPTPSTVGTWEDRSREFARVVASLGR